MEARYLLTLASGATSRDADVDALAGKLAQSVGKLGIDDPCQVLIGAPANAIVEDAAASDAELIVLTTRPKHTRTMVRAIAEAVVRRAACSVLVVRDPVAQSC